MSDDTKLLIMIAIFLVLAGLAFGSLGHRAAHGDLGPGPKVTTTKQPPTHPKPDPNRTCGPRHNEYCLNH